MNLPLIGIDKLLADSWNSMLKDWKQTLGWTLGIMFVPTLINIVFALPQIAAPELRGSFLIQMVAFFLATGTSIYFTAGLFRYFLNKEKPVSVSFQNVVSLFWIGAIMALILIPAFLFFIIPGIWLAVAFSMAVPIYLNEGKGGWQSIKASYSLIKGRWWATVIRFIIPNFVYGIGVSFIFGVIITIFILVAGAAASGVVLALAKGVDSATALATLGPVAVISLIVCALVFLLCFIITNVFLSIAYTSIWTNLYKSLSETTTQ